MLSLVTQSNFDVLKMGLKILNSLRSDFLKFNRDDNLSVIHMRLKGFRISNIINLKQNGGISVCQKLG